MKNKNENAFIPDYAQWKEQCRNGAKAVPVTLKRYTTNEIYVALCNLKTSLNYGNNKTVLGNLR
jgi:hypothetical protein